ncbi:MAG: SDR family oxidoreductase [Cyanobacteria bacterium REEB67]|nr:SDR family oxidoreductase [Cyanobacteria bacterium REEB67]
MEDISQIVAASCFAPQLFRGKRVLITGASRGIGRACSLAFARLGADLVLISKNAQNLSAVQKELGLLGSGQTVLIEAADLADAEALNATLKRIKDRLDGIDILINNAGIYITEAVADHSLASWQRTMDTNLTSAMLLSSQLVSGMVDRRWGRIINISSMSGRSGEAYGAAYSASKFALIGLTQSLALEVAVTGVTVNAVCPGWVATDMAFGQLTDQRWCELNQLEVAHSVDTAKFSVPQQRLIEASEVADLVIYLATDAARGITGQAINICGGLSIHS